MTRDSLILIKNSADNGEMPLFPGPRGLILQRARQLRAQGMQFHREQDLPPVAGDCASFVRECYRFGGFSGAPTTFRMDAAVLGGSTFVETLEKRVGFCQVSSPQVADLAVFRWMHFPQHLALVSHIYDGNDLDIIHLCNSVGKVSEHPLSGEWQHRLVGFWSHPLVPPVPSPRSPARTPLPSVLVTGSESG